MVVRTWCPKCGKKIKGGDEWAGKLGQCPSCASVVGFPAAASTEDSSTSVAPYTRKHKGKLKACRDCGHLVSQVAEACPQCGCASPALSETTYGNIALFAVVVGLLVGVIMIVVFRIGWKMMDAAIDAVDTLPK